jgi:hypothetical protein
MPAASEENLKICCGKPAGLSPDLEIFLRMVCYDESNDRDKG